ncbi:hypothetical protein DEM27_09255 [Metarhizobium album]|uniref:DUF992 domain-containing protein n=1 Tax=Metarhizobium album TaxID=2182425 RepID=A0A2U2DTE8_9HYPH|nr:hypothetical protein [Rhizobium album]PWE56557.1 hypothetical protein DEM27_09255 [Rhizobium album]
MPRPIAFASLAAAFLLTPLAAMAGEVECHANKEYAVAVQSDDEDAGAQFAVTALRGKKKPASCRFDADKADLVIGEPGDPLWYGDQSGKYLILTRSTGPQGDLVVYDLSTGKAVLDVPADEYEVSGNTLAFWERTGEATAENCPGFAENQANGMGSAVVERKQLDLKSLKIDKTGEERCDATQ